MPNRSAFRALLLTNNTTRWSVGGADYTQMKRKRHPFTGASSLGWRPNIPAGRSRSDPSRNIESRGSTGFRPNIGLISARFTNLTGKLVNASRQPLTFPPSPAWPTARALKTRHNAGRPRLNHLLINGYLDSRRSRATSLTASSELATLGAVTHTMPSLSGPGTVFVNRIGYRWS